MCYKQNINDSTKGKINSTNLICQNLKTVQVK